MLNHIKNFISLNISLTDQDGDILDLNGYHFSLTLQIDIVFKIKILSQYRIYKMGLGLNLTKGINRLGRKVENTSNK
jgi:hypothetical protein